MGKVAINVSIFIGNNYIYSYALESEGFSTFYMRPSNVDFSEIE